MGHGDMFSHLIFSCFRRELIEVEEIRLKSHEENANDFCRLCDVNLIEKISEKHQKHYHLNLGSHGTLDYPHSRLALYQLS